MKIALLLLLLTTRIASADEIILESVCAVVEPSDILDEDSRNAAQRLLVRTLERADQLVVDRDCTMTFRVAHVRIDGVVVVRIAGPVSTRRFSHATPEKLPEIYETLVRALLAERPAGASIPIPAMPPPTSERREVPPAPFPTPALGTEGTIARGGLWTLRGGLGGSVGMGGVSFGGFGYRRNLGEYAVDVSIAGSGGDDDGSQGTTARMVFQVLRFDSGRPRSTYYGGGVSFGSTAITEGMGVAQFQPVEYRGEGFGLELTAGYAFARTSRTVQSFMQLELSLPFYTADGGGGSYYPVSLVASFGLGFGGK